MPCASCAAEVDANALVCADCGAAVISTGVGPDSDTSLAPEQALFAGTLLDADRHLEGLGGWLTLIGISLVLSPLLMLSTIAKSDLPMLLDAKYQPFLEKHTAIHMLILFEVATNLCFIAVLGALNYLFFKKKRSFPTYMILYLAFHVVFLCGDAVAAYVISPATQGSAESVSSTIRTVVSAAVWVPYFLISRRVKATFVH